MNIRKLLLASMLSLGVCAAFAQAPGGGADQGPGQGPRPRLSAEEREKRCQANPEKCAEIKQKIENRREERKKKCDADPKACAEKKAQIREKMEERRQGNPEAMKERRENMQNAPRQPAR